MNRMVYKDIKHNSFHNDFYLVLHVLQSSPTFYLDFFYPNRRYIRLSAMQITKRFFPVKLKKWFGTLQEYPIF